MYVGITGAVIHGVKGKIHQMRMQELNTISAADSITLTGSESWIPQLLWGKHLELRNKIPKEWKSYIERIIVEKVEYKGQSFDNVTMHVAQKVDAPPVERHRYYGATFKTLDGLDPAEIDKDWFDGQLEVKEIEARWDKVERQVVSFLESSKSLNEALKLWPQVEAYIPSEYMNRVREKREVKKAESNAAEVLKSIDTDELTAAAVMARMSSPNK